MKIYNKINKTNNTTNKNTDSPNSVNNTEFMAETYKLLSPEVKKWFGKLLKASMSGKAIIIK